MHLADIRASVLVSAENIKNNAGNASVEQIIAHASGDAGSLVTMYTDALLHIINA